MAPRKWRVRVYSFSASYQMGPYYCVSRDEALQESRAERRRTGNRDMLGWNLSAWEERA